MHSWKVLHYGKFMTNMGFYSGRFVMNGVMVTDLSCTTGKKEE